MKTEVLGARSFKAFFPFVLLMLFSSCYISQESVYTGRNTLPESVKSSKAPGYGRIPRVFAIEQLPAPELKIRPEISRELSRFKNREQKIIQVAHEFRKKHYRTLKQIFIDEGIPLELLSVALVESGYRTDARSSQGAVGMWQFMKPTAKAYGLSIGFLEDQRKDPVLSTIAAARLLRDLYEAYNDWPLALAAYNAGPARVDRALVDSGSKDYWELCTKGYFGTETQRFVPKILAAAIIEKNPTLYGFNLEEETNGDQGRPGV